MSIKFQLAARGDGEPTLTVLAAATLPATYDDLREYTKTEMEDKIRDKLAAHADAMHWWTDEYLDKYAGEPTAAEVRLWARKQVAKF